MPTLATNIEPNLANQGGYVAAWTGWSEKRFACRFAPLPLPAHLADHQEALLDRIDPGWTTQPQPVQ